MKDFNKVIILFFIIQNQLNVFSQVKINDSIPVDPLIPKSVQIRINNFDFLIKENVYYNFFVSQIRPLNEGYLIECQTIIDTYKVYVYIITNKNSIFSKGKKIKKYHTYSLCLKKYFEKPSLPGIEISKIHDVMLGENTICVYSTGLFNYLHTSFNLEGLTYLDSNQVKKKIERFENAKSDFDKIVCQFVNKISYNDNNNLLFQILDTNQLIKCFKKYNWSVFGRSPSFYLTDDPYPPSKKDPVNWVRSYKINSFEFNDMFWAMLKEDYKLPKIKQNEKDSILCKDISIELLFLNIDIFTIRIKWNIPNIKNEYVAVLNIKKIENKYLISGFNKVYYPYSK